ncbi:MAG: sigma-54 dependent transcriptional regulator [Nitrospira sp.]|nr:sigma-54-dependent Fis family transcriptional regulator [Candidatus Manganitrophaceae bacterium]HIL35662.1 sigma-54-dependent Fis family transcriptional regulator [Candidatus Manganitrophaceae bacterium]
MTQGVLIIEDEVTLAKNIKRYLKLNGYDVQIAENGKEGLHQVETFKPDMILLDLKLPDCNGLEILPKIKNIDPQIHTIIMTGHGNVHAAVDAMKMGAYDFLEKPLILAEVKVILDKAVGLSRIEGTLSYYQKKYAGGNDLSALIGESQPMLSLKEQIRKLNASEHALTEGPPPSVLITGETGTGKELIARALHFNGPRKEEPFVEINCSSIPNHLLESEFFGYERGAFTDAKTKKQGLFEVADKGTLFLDEIGEIDISLQPKLLKCLEEKVIRRLGGIRDKKVDIRVITATNQSLEELINIGKFRSDLYFRLNIIHLKAPPLRTREKDILLLAEHFLKKQCKRYRKPEIRLSLKAKELLLRHPWPGNVRELHNFIEQTVFCSQQETIREDQIQFNPVFGNARQEGGSEGNNEISGDQFILPSQGIIMENVERDFIVQSLERSAWNVTKAAKALGFSRDTLRYRMEKFDLVPPTEE